MGRDIIDWRQPATLSDLRHQGWSSQTALTMLQEKTWHNPHPEKVITHIDFVSGKKTAAPFLMGVTLDDK